MKRPFLRSRNARSARNRAANQSRSHSAPTLSASDELLRRRDDFIVEQSRLTGLTPMFCLDPECEAGRDHARVERELCEIERLLDARGISYVPRVKRHVRGRLAKEAAE